MVCLTVLEPNGVNTMSAQTTVRSLTVTWAKPAGTVTGYKIELKDIDNTQQTLQKRQYVFNSLMAGKLYTVILYAVIGDLQSEPLEKDFYTSKCGSINLSHITSLSIRLQKSYPAGKYLRPD